MRETPIMIPDHESCQELSRNEWFCLYRGCCQEDGRFVLLKAPCGEPASSLAVRLLEHEYALLQGLSLPGVVRVHEFLRHERGCCLVLEDYGGMPLRTLLTRRRLDLDAFFNLAFQLTTILAELHRREIMHRHLNPWSILPAPHDW